MQDNKGDDGVESRSAKAVHIPSPASEVWTRSPARPQQWAAQDERGDDSGSGRGSDCGSGSGCGLLGALQLDQGHPLSTIPPRTPK
jgi:hypothetical protein